MTKAPTGDKSPTEMTTDNQPLSEAVRQVNAAIASARKQLEEIAHTEEQEPIMLEGETTAGYQVKMMLAPNDVAKVMLEYDYPTHYILQEDAPMEMWDDLAKMVGLGRVDWVDISLKAETKT